MSITMQTERCGLEEATAAWRWFYNFDMYVC